MKISSNRISSAVLAGLVALTPVALNAQPQPVPPPKEPPARPIEPAKPVDHAASAHAHSADTKAKGHHSFDDLDTNKDGSISRSEFDAAHAKPATDVPEHACGEGKCGAAMKDAAKEPSKKP